MSVERAAPEPVHVDDRDLFRRALRGESGAREQLGLRLDRIRQVVERRAGHAARGLPEVEAGEIASEVVAALWTARDRYDGRASLEAWAGGFAARLAWRARRQARRHRVLLLRPSVEVPPPDPGLAELRGRVRRALEGLRPAEASVLRLRHLEERSFPEISDELAVPLNTVKTRYYRSLERLRRRLGSVWEEYTGLEGRM